MSESSNERYADASEGSYETSASTTGPGKADERSLVWATVWNVRAAPPSRSVKATLVPRKLQPLKPRKISIEVHRVKTVAKQTRESKDAKGGSNRDLISKKEKVEDSYYEECVFRMWRKAAKKDGKRQVAAVDAIVQEEEAEEAKLNLPGEWKNSNAVPLRETEGWVAKFQFPLRFLSIKKTTLDSMVLFVDQDGRRRNSREFFFGSHEDVEDFGDMIKREKALDAERLETKMKASLGGLRLKPGERLDLLIEIVSGWNLPIADLSSSDPMVVCSVNGKEVHRTKHIPKNLDPIWTLQTGSLFVLSIDSTDLFTGDGLFCRVKDYDLISNDDLGHFIVSPATLYKANGEREVYKLRPPSGKKGKVPGHMAVRCRRATPYDKTFMAEFVSSQTEKASDVLNIAQTSQGGKSNIQSIMAKNEKVDKSGVKRYKLRPGSDPKRKDATEWMTKEEMAAEILDESQHWIDSGSGKLGKIYVEILGCEGLPNLDTGGFLGNKTDAFVSVVFEDAIVRTDIIDDTLKPKWMPWMKRAFIFHMSHSSSQMFVGVFDSDLGMDDHDLIGKVSVDLTNLEKNTVYDLKYDIFKSANMSERKSRGSIRLRLRVEVEDERKFLLACLEPPPNVYINVKTQKDFKVVRHTTAGKYDMEQYSMRVMNSYIEELLAYQHVLYYIEDAIISLLMWRSHAEFTIFGRTFGVPYHSFIAFTSFTLLVEKPQLMPSFFFLSVAWFLIAVMSFRRHAPNPWNRCKSYTELWNMLVLGNAMTPPQAIAHAENFEEVSAVTDAWDKRMSESEERAKKAYEESLKAQAEYEKDMAEIGEGDTDISTKAGGVSVDIFKPIFFPIQQNLALVCRMLRSARAVVTWDECYFAFWISTLCAVLGFAFLFIPWFWILKWTARSVVWTIFGPWMKLVDLFYYSRLKPLSEDEIDQKKETERMQRQEATSNAATANRIKRENAAKLKNIKKFMFGNFISKVPILKSDRYRDVPCSESAAVPYKPDPLGLAELAMKEAGYGRTRLPGQNLEGDMIPRIEAVAFTDAPIGQATANPELLDRSGPGGAGGSTETTATVYAKIGSVVALATIVTWFAVPVLSTATEKVLSWF